MGFSPKELRNIEYNLKNFSKDIFKPEAEEAWSKIITDFIKTLREIQEHFAEEN